MLSVGRFFHDGTGNTGAIDQYDATGVLLRTIPFEGLPHSLAADRFGNLYALSDFSRLNKYDVNGQLVSSTTFAGLNTTLGVGIDSFDRIYIGENGSIDRIYRLATKGASLELFATVSTPVGGAPFALVFDSNHRLYVPDYELVERFSPMGQSLGVFATIPSLNDFITHLALDSSGNLYAQTLYHNIHVFDAGGMLLHTMSLSTSSSPIEIDANDVLYAVTGSAGKNVTRFTTAGVSLGAFAVGGGEIYSLAVHAVPEPLTATMLLPLAPMLHRQAFRRRKTA